MSEGLRVNDLQKKLRILRGSEDTVSGLLIVLVLIYVRACHESKIADS